MVERGQIHTVRSVAKASGGQLVHCDGVSFGIVGGPEIAPGDVMEVGNVCGGWCFLFVKGERVRANIVEMPVERES